MREENEPSRRDESGETLPSSRLFGIQGQHFYEIFDVCIATGILYEGIGVVANTLEIKCFGLFSLQNMNSFEYLCSDGIGNL